MEINLKFSVERLNEILVALSSLPYSQSSGIIAEIHQQAQPQVDAFNAMQEKAKQETDSVIEKVVAEPVN